jgi:hypothetical protein
MEASEAGAEAKMNKIERTWFAFMAAIDEARDLHQRGAGASELADLLRHARELLDIIETEVAAQSIAIPDNARGVLARLRGRLTYLEQDVMPTRH